MNTAEYRDEISALSDSILSFRSCVSFDERSEAAKRLGRAWERLSLLAVPKRLPKSVSDKCDRVRKQAADLLNDWAVELAAGKPEVESVLVPHAKAMADTMKFCSSMKKHGF